jgi:peptidoglycan/xylan/chitin deacetylase (PgdA/CDA1 family)
MRVVLSIVAGLMILGLAAYGVVSAQKITANPAAPNTRVASLSPAMPAAGSPPAAQARLAQVVSQIAQAATGGFASRGTRIAAQTDGAPGTDAAAPGNAGAPNAQAKPAPAAASIPPCDKPGGMGLSRIVEIDTTGGPGFGTQHFNQYDFLRDKEVVLTFDDGPWPVTTAAVLKALADECVKATFFEIGKHATWHPSITKEVIDAGMTVGTHTWSHKDLARKPYATDLDQAQQEIEMGNSAVHMAAAGAPIAPFFRFPYLQHPPQILSYLGERNIAVFSTDIDSRDFRMHNSEDVIKSVMSQLEKRGRGIILMHDFKRHTAEAMPELLSQLKAGGYKVVHVVAKGQLTTLPKYDEMVAHQDKLSANNSRPESSVVHTIGEYMGGDYIGASPPPSAIQQ